MARDSSKSTHRERALRETRERLTRLEIETHRIKAELARLESEIEIERAEELEGELGAVATNGHAPATSSRSIPQAQTAGIGLAPARKSPTPAATLPRVRVAATGVSKAPKRRSKRRATPAWAMSLAVHAAVLALLAPMGFAILANDDIPLFASMFDVDESSFDPGVMPVEMVVLDEDFAVQEAIYSEPSLPLAESLVEDFSPLPTEEAAEPATTPGLLSALPSDIGTLTTGGGNEESTGRGRGRTGRNEMAGELGRTSFFGTSARANRVVFVIDNSSSMKGGRLERAIDELLSSVESMTPRQSFYVIFVSDQPYPMFYPQAAPALVPATKQNKQALREWMSRVVLASGKNREIIRAMDMAAALGPEAVYLLWDGDMKYSDRVRHDVMTHLTRPNQWRFAIHTLGMGVTSLDAQYNLATIAEAHGGTYRPVPIPSSTR